MILLVISLLSVVANSEINPPENGSKVFYEQVLSDFNRHSLFIACNITSPSYNGKVVIENDDLYAYFKQQNGFSKKKYKSYILHKLANASKIDVKSQDLLKWKFLKVSEIAEVNQQISVGNEEFVCNFFTKRVINKGLNFEVRNAVIYQLCSRRIRSKTDDETGYLYLPLIP